MDRIDKLINRVKPKLRPWQRLEQDNPYLEKNFDELLEMMSGDNYQAPEMRTREWDKFIYAVVHAFGNNDIKKKGNRGGSNQIKD